jgi:hypothetical protein
MFNNPFNKPSMHRPQRQNTDCKIKMKKTADGGSQISFSGNCSKEQLQMAKLNLESGDDYEDDDE